MYPLKFTVLKSAEPDLQDTWTKIRDLNYFRNEACHTKSKTLTSKHKIRHAIQYHCRQLLVQQQRNPSECSLRQQESNRLEIERKSVHKRTQAKSMAEQKEQTEHPDLHPWGWTLRPTLPRRNRSNNSPSEKRRRGERRRNRFWDGRGAERGTSEVKKVSGRVKRWLGENGRLKPTTVAKPTISSQLQKIIPKIKYK